MDGAGDYGNEKEAGEGVRRAIADGLVKREDLCKYIIVLSALNKSSRKVFSHHLQGIMLR